MTRIICLVMESAQWSVLTFLFMKNSSSRLSLRAGTLTCLILGRQTPKRTAPVKDSFLEKLHYYLAE